MADRAERGGLEDAVRPDGAERLAALSEEAGCATNKLAELFSEACRMAKDGELETQFLFFALHGDNMYRQPTHARDYRSLCESGVAYHTGRPDYKFHGTIVKTPVPAMLVDEAVVCRVCKGGETVAAVAALADYDYREVLSLM